jgi:hypothetical protein
LCEQLDDGAGFEEGASLGGGGFEALGEVGTVEERLEVRVEALRLFE